MSTPEAYFAAGDFLAGIAQIYVGLLGPVFYAILVFLIMTPLYFRSKSIILPLIVSILLAGVFEGVLPGPVIDFARFFTIIGIASGLFLVSTRGRN